jgi:two-component system chemotaxis response regulator CheY
MPHTGNSGKVLLIVDSSSLIIERLIGILGEGKKSKKIFSANDYAGAITVLNENKTDIVLLDIQLPGKNGIDLLKFIVKDHPAVKVVILTNLVSYYYQKLCREIGAVHFMDKSKDFESIPGVVAGL